MNLEKNILEKTIELAKSLGAEECDVILSKENSTRVSANQGNIDQFKISNTQILGLRVIKNNRIGLSYTESMDEDAILFAIKNAIENSQYSNENLHEKICVQNLSPQINTQIANEKVTIQEMIDMTINLESETIKKNPKINNVPWTTLIKIEASKFYLNSLDTFTQKAFSYYLCYSSANAKNEKITTSSSKSTLFKNFKDFNIDKIITPSVNHAVDLLEAEKLESDKYDILFDVELLAEIFNCFTNYFSAKSAIEKFNPFAEKLNTPIAHPELTIKDSPQYPDTLFPSYFDDEGHETKELSLIENGVLKNFIHNTSTANYFGVKSTGHASRSSKTALSVSHSNIVVSKGKLTNQEVKKGRYIEIKDLMGLHSGTSAISGDFSFGANGYLCEDGKRICAVNGFTVAGNFGDILKNISAIGDTLEANSDYNFFSPLIKFSSLSIAGK